MTEEGFQRTRYWEFGKKDLSIINLIVIQTKAMTSLAVYKSIAEPKACKQVNRQTNYTYIVLCYNLGKTAHLFLEEHESFASYQSQ